MCVGLATAALAIPWSGAPGDAKSNGEWSVFPVAGETDDPTALPRPFFDYQVAPGATIEDEVVVTNLTDEAIRLVLYPADAYNSENAGEFTLDLQSASREGIGRWVRLSAGRLELPPRTEAVVPFTIDFPEDLPPGDYAGGIVALNEETEPLDDTGFLVQNAVGTRIYTRVDGATTPGLEITDLHLRLSTAALQGVTGDGDGELTYQITNIGNIRIAGTAQASVRRTFGDEILFDPVDVPELLPGEELTITERWSGLPPAGVVTADVTVTAETFDIETTRSTRSVVIPWFLVVAAALLIFGLLLRRRRRKRSSGTEADTTTIRLGRKRRERNQSNSIGATAGTSARAAELGDAPSEH